MSVFEYVLIFLTLVLGLGVTRNLTAIAELDFSTNRREAFLDLTWLASIILLHIDYWFGIWSQTHTKESWHVLELLLWLGVAVCLFMAGAYISQSIKSDAQNKRSNFRMAIWALVSWLIFVVVTVNYNLALSPTINIIWLVPLTLLLVARFSTSQALTTASTVAFFAWAIVMVGFIGDSEISQTTNAVLRSQ